MISIRKLISISIQLNIEACRIIKQSINNKNLKKYMKDIDDPVTQADYKIQSMLIKGIKTYFPNLKIIGQQTKQYEGQIQYDYKQIDENFLPEAIKINEQLPQKQVCLWIDPIDCTKGFINGKVQNVTILMGLSFSQKASVGIVGIPFYKHQQDRIYKPVIVFGSKESKEAYEFIVEQKQYKRLNIPQYDNKTLRIAVTENRSNNQHDIFSEKMKGTLVRAAGSGRKLMMVARGQAEMMIYLSPSTHKWDTCACEAIVLAMGGYLMSSKGEHLTYNFNNSDTINRDGIICTLQKQLHKKVMDNMLIKV